MPNFSGIKWLRHQISKRIFGGENGGVLRGMATLAMGSGIGRFVGLASIPILTRLYSPEDFGVLAVFTALVTILAPLVTLRYVLVIPLPRHDGMAINLLAISTGLMVLSTVLVALGLWLGGSALLQSMSMDVLEPWLWLIALGVFGTATYEMLSLWATRRRDYKVIAQTNVTQSLAGAALKIGLGLASLQPIGLLIGQVVAQTAGVGRLLRGFMAEFRSSWRHVSAYRMHKIAWGYRGFPMWRVPSQLLLVFSTQAPMLFIASFYGPQITGQFGLAVTALYVPVALIGQSAGKALYGEAARTYIKDPANVVKMARNTQISLFSAAIIPAAILFLFGETIFTLVFGNQWRLAGTFASILTISMLFQFTSSPLMSLFNILSNQSIYLGINIFRAIGLILVFWVGSRYVNEPVSLVMAYSLFNSLFYFLVSIILVHMLKKKFPK